MTEPTPDPDETGEGLRTRPASGRRAQVNSARPNGARRTATLDTVPRDERTPTNGTHHTSQIDGQHTSQNGAQHASQNSAQNGAQHASQNSVQNGAQHASQNGMHYGSQTGAEHGGQNAAHHTSAEHGGQNGAHHTSQNGTSQNGMQHGRDNGARNGSKNGTRNGTHNSSAALPTMAHAENIQNDTMDVDATSHGTPPGSNAHGEKDPADTSPRPSPRTNGHATNGRARSGQASNNKHASANGHQGDGRAGVGPFPRNGAPAGSDDLGIASIGIPGGGFTGAGVGGGEPVTFGFGENAGVLPGDQRTFDDVEAGIVALWRRFGERREQLLRDRLVLHYAPLVKYVAGRVGTGLPAHVEVADLIQSGIFGLVDAIEKFEPERGLKFETYAMQRIRGAILDDLRAQDWVPRSVRGRAREVERALERLGAKLRRTPTDAELADELGLSQHELRDVYAQLQLTSVVALDELAAAGRGPTPLADILEDQEALDPVALLVDQDNRRQLAQAIAHLAERDRVVVTLYYFENLTLAEIGRVLGVTESRVCQLHTRAVLRLRAKLLEKTDA
jgi:RNA polymerase sigma factor for flagellar operon FliA